MLATFIIGLREGLEAALIVGIVATFLTKNGRRLTPMWIGVSAAVLLSLAVGTGLALVEKALPQAAQEGLETVIGAVAVLFVTSMILWMSAHARGLKRELEASAQHALGGGGSTALAAMAFLAVLKEGFESAVFLLATFQASTNTITPALGAVLGILVAVGLGVGIYRGGVRLNLSRFFRATGVFLVLVAAGLVVRALRTAHEAGWLNAGQQRTLDLSWLAPVGSVRGALFTGVLGIPADPRLVEVLGWVAFLLPMMLIVLWPQARRPGVAVSNRIKQVLAGAALATAAALVAFGAAPAAATSAPAPLVDATGASAGTATLRGTTLTRTLDGAAVALPLHSTGDTVHDGSTAEHLTGPAAAVAGELPATLTLAELVALGGGRVPVGVDVQRNPGPYAARWAGTSRVDAWVVDGRLLDATCTQRVVLTLSGGGLPTPRTLTVSPGSALPGGHLAPAGWRVEPAYVGRTAHEVRALAADRTEAHFWGRFVPVLLVLTSLALLLVVRRRRATTLPAPSGSTTHEGPATDTTNTPRSNVHAG